MNRTTLTFDLVKSCENSRIDYGFVFSRDRQKIFLIKTGQDGSIYGYQNKYLKLACELRDKFGFSVVCASTPSVEIDQIAQFAKIVQSEFEITDATKIYFMGMSKGASIGCLRYASFPQVSRFLLINPPLMINTIKLCRCTQEFTGERMAFVFGSLDPSARLASLLKLYERENVRISIIPGQDHHFSKDNFNLLELIKSIIL
jgi:dienelactone hydrolase